MLNLPRAGLAGLFLAVLTISAFAGTIPIDALPLPNRVAKADAVVVGKVTSIEDKTVAAEAFPGAKNKKEYKIAVITVTDGLIAPKGARTIRLGFVPLPKGVMINPRPLQPSVGMEGCFFLRHHGEADFFTAPSGLDFIGANNNERFAKDLAMIKRCVKLLGTTEESLKSDKAEDRFITAGMLLAKFRTRRVPNAKEEQIPAEQSKLILKAIAGADWTPSNDYMQLSPRLVLFRLPLTAADGWAPPKNAKELPAYAQKWLNEHAETYRIRRFVVEKVN